MTTTALQRARAGDPTAFADLAAAHRRELHAHCYRMLGSVDDADEVLQEILLAAWRGLDGFDGRSSLRTWLYAIATRRCLNAIRDGRRRPPPAPRPPFDPPAPSRHGDVTWLQPYPDAWLDEIADPAAGPSQRHARRATLELAFVAALQALPPRQTAAVVLADALGFSVGEIAQLLGEPTPATVKGLLQRARAALALAQPREAQVTAHSSRERELSGRLADAFGADDVEGVIALLTDDAWLTMPPATHAYQGLAAIGGFLAASAAARGGRHFALTPTRANTQPAFITSLAGEPVGVLVLTACPSGIAAVTHFLQPRLAARIQAAAGS